MSTQHDEQKLTAYALGELNASEMQEIEAILAGDAEARAFVESIRSTAMLVQDALHDEMNALPMEPATLKLHRPRTNLRIFLAAATAACLAFAAGSASVMLARKGTPTHSVVLVPPTQPSTQSIPNLIKRSRQLAAEGHYDEALGVVDQILALDPKNDYATGVRPLIYDRKLFREQHKYNEQFDRAVAEQLNLNDERKIPYSDVLRFPENWPNLSLPRDDSVAPNTREPGLTLNSTVTTTSNLDTKLPGNLSSQLDGYAGAAGRNVARNNLLPMNASTAQMRYSTAGSTLDIITPLQKREVAVGSGQHFAVQSAYGMSDPIHPSTPRLTGKEDAAVQAQLDRKLPEMRFDAVPLDDVLDFMSNVSGSDLYVDWDSLKAVGVDRKAPVSARVGDIRFQDALKAVLADVSKGKPGVIGFSAKNGFIQVDRADQLDKEFNTESYDRITDNAFLDVLNNPLSTFSVDVDTASYSNIRRFLTGNQLPPKDAVRIEEMVNYFSYDYPPPTDGKPFATAMEVASCPWNEKHQLLRIAIKGKEIAQDKRPPSNLVFLLDVSGSMNEPNKLPLVKQSMKAMLGKLGENDRVAIVVYAGSSGLVLSSTNAMEKARIAAAIDELSAGGSTNGAQGIELAYAQASENFIKDGTNRVILCTDGDFNVGITDQGSLTRLIEEKAKTGVFLSVLGFGMGNTKDSTMEKLADKGNGNYAYIDNFNEARKVLVEQMSGTLVTIAKDVKLQLEFNPAKVAGYRLIGYENRVLAKEDFNDDKKDAGEIGAGHTVTALYELVPTNESTTTQPAVDPLKYQKPVQVVNADELLTLKLRYKQPDGQTSELQEFTMKDQPKSFNAATKDFQFAASVAGFGMILRDSPYKGSANLGAVLEIAQGAKGVDASGYRTEFIEMLKKATELKK